MAKTIILFIVSFLAVAIALYYLIKREDSASVRTLNFLLFFAGILGLADCWFSVYFPPTRFWGTPGLSGEEVRNLLWWNLCAVVWGLPAFFGWLCLHKNTSADRFLLKGIGMFGVFISFVLLVGITCLTNEIVKPIKSITVKTDESHNPVGCSGFTPNPTLTVVVHTPVPATIFMPKGGSLCGILHMSRNEALDFAKKYHMKYWYKKSKLYVLVYPNDAFHQINGKWEPLLR